MIRNMSQVKENMSQEFKIVMAPAVFGVILAFKGKHKFKKLTIEKLSESSLRRCTKFGQVHSNDERKRTLSLILHFILDFWI